VSEAAARHVQMSASKEKMALWCTFRTDEEAAFESLVKIDFPQALTTSRSSSLSRLCNRGSGKEQLNQFAPQSNMTDGKQSLPDLRKTELEH
jgi:hypothetical protein